MGNTVRKSLVLQEVVENRNGEEISCNCFTSYKDDILIVSVANGSDIFQFLFRVGEWYELLTFVSVFIQDEKALTIITKDFTFSFDKTGGTND